jgi:hypothetical protein
MTVIVRAYAGDAVSADRADKGGGYLAGQVLPRWREQILRFVGLM